MIFGGAVGLAMLVIESLRSPAPVVAADSSASVLALRIGAPPDEAATSSESYHVVEAGETLSGIAAERLGDPALADELAAINGLRDADALVPGQVLRLR